MGQLPGVITQKSLDQLERVFKKKRPFLLGSKIEGL